MMRKRQTQLSVVIPAYNEAERIVPTLERAISYLERQRYFYEIIVVDDGSTDNTHKAVRPFVHANYNIRLVGYRENRGKGYAVKYGMERAHGDYRLFIDADGAISIDHLDIFWRQIEEGHDVVIGSIELPGHRAEDNNKWYRRILGKLAKILIRFTATPGIYDTQRAFKLFSRDAAISIFDYQTIWGWGFDIELMVIARKHNYSIKEIPVIWINPDGSRVTGIQAYIKTLFELFDIMKKRLLGVYSISVLNPRSVLGRPAKLNLNSNKFISN